jgi:hypothetical protein
MFATNTLEDTAVLTWRGRDPLSWLLTPRALDEFLEHDWERQALVLKRGDGAYYGELLTFADVNAFMSRNDIRYPYLRLVKNGRELPLVDYADDFVYGNNIFPACWTTTRSSTTTPKAPRSAFKSSRNAWRS